jgi:DNA-binding IclR family transcriptional regulator
LSKEIVVPTETELRGDRNFVTALARGLEILRCFNRPQIELSVSEIARLTGLSQPTAWRLCYTLLECGFLVRAPSGSGLCIGAPAITLGYAAAKGARPTAIALPYMQRLAEETSCSATLSLRQNGEVISVEQVIADFVLPNQPIGWRAPLVIVSAGLAVLAALPPAERDLLTDEMAAREGARWPRHQARIADAVAEFAREGYVTLSGMLDGQYTAVAVPLFETGTKPKTQWALSCGTLSSRWSEAGPGSAAGKLLELRALLTPAFAALAD